jgi:hypothetical protein
VDGHSKGCVLYLIFSSSTEMPTLEKTFVGTENSRQKRGGGKKGDAHSFKMLCGEEE